MIHKKEVSAVTEQSHGTDLAKNTRFRTKKPGRYHVLMHNDDVTTMDFVVMLLQRVFHHTEEDAEDIMLKIHNEGWAIVGTYYKDIAMSKTSYAISLAREEGFPLQLTIKEAE